MVPLSRKDAPNLLSHGLLVRRPLSNLILRCWSSFGKSSKAPPIPRHPKKILLCNIAHLGDVVISTAALAALHKKFPDCKIGFLTSSLSAPVLQHHPLVHKIHCFDHWYLHKTLSPSSHLLEELKQEAYEIGIDLYCYFPNAIPLLKKSQIPIRIGYTTGGFHKRLTHPLAWNFQDRYMGHTALHPLSLLGIDPSQESPLPYYPYKRQTQNHIAIHLGSQQPLKEWDLEQWIPLIRKLKNYPILLTGKGEREALLCKTVAERTSATNLCNQLDWPSFTQTIQEARLLLSIDSAAIHLAAATQTPTIALFTGPNIPAMWAPPSPTLHHFVKTATRDIDPEEVYIQTLKLLELHA